MRRSPLVALAATTAIFTGSAGVAFADTVYIQSASVSAAPGTTVSFALGLTPESPTGDPNGCNATPGQPVTITFTSSNAQVASAPSSVSITGCDDPSTHSAIEGAVQVSVPISNSAAASASTTITALGSGGKTVKVNAVDQSVLNTDSILVNVAGKQAQAKLSVTGPLAGTFGQTYPITIGGGNGTGALSYAVSGSACQPAGSSSVRITHGTGTCSITATRAADATYEPAMSAPLDVVVARAAQATLSVTSPMTGTFGEMLDLVADGGSGAGAVTFSATGAACSVTPAGKLQVLSGTGACDVTARKAADADHLAVTSAALSVDVRRATQAALVMTSPSTAVFGDAFTPAAEGGNGDGALTYVATGSACAIPTSGGDSGMVVITSGTGDCTVTATRAATADYAAVDSAAQTITVSRAAQQGLAVVAASTGSFGDVLPLSYTGGSGTGDLTFSAGDSTACRLAPTTDALEITSGTGTCSITVSRAQDANFQGATSPAHPVSATKRPAAIELTGTEVVYDGSAKSVGVTTTPSGLGDVVLTYNGSTTPPTAAGSYTVVATLDDPDYAGSEEGTLLIEQAVVTGGFTADDKDYDGSATAGVTPHLSGSVDGDDVMLVVTGAAFASPAAGTSKTVTGKLSLTGRAAANYLLVDATATDTADVRRKPLTGSFAAGSKVYDALPGAGVASSSLPGVVTPDLVVLAVTEARFADKSVGTGKTVTASLALSGADAGNYVLTSPTASSMADITPAPVSVILSAQPKTYDATTSVRATGALAGGIYGDDLALGLSGATFADKHAGRSKVVTADLALSGLDAGNYALTARRASTTAAISPAPLTGSFDATSKIYDGSRAAMVSSLGLQRILGEDQVALVLEDPQFTDKHVGTGKSVSGAASLIGADARNYALSSPPSARADIAAKALGASFTALDRVYDGTTAAGISAGAVDSADVVDGDDVTLVTTGASAAFSNKDVGTGKAVTGSGFTLGGTDRLNYAVTVRAASASITPAPLTVTASSPAALQQGDAVPTIAPLYSGFVAREGTGLVTTRPTCSTTYTSSSPIGTYPTSCSGAEVPNYSVNYAAGSVTVLYRWHGFFAPIDNNPDQSGDAAKATVYNAAKAGSAIPVKFDLSGDQGLALWPVDPATGAVKAPTASKVACTSAPSDALEELATATTSGLKYDAATNAPYGQYNYTWKTTTAYAGTCQRLTVTLKDGTSHYAFFKFSK